MEFDGQVAVVTGGGRGIGRAIALELGAAGATVVVNYRSNAAAAAEVVAELGDRGHAVQADVSTNEGAATLIVKAEELGGLNILVNNAGITADNLLLRMTDEMFYDGVNLCQVALTIEPIEKTSSQVIDGKNPKYFMCEFSYQPLDQAAQDNLEAATKHLRIWREETFTMQADVQLCMNWDPETSHLLMDEEATEDAYRLVGLNEEDRVFTRPINSVKKRLPWLTLNLLTAVLISSVVGIFEQTIARLSILAVLMPIVAGLGGNSGTQTLTVITRGIALGELTIHNTWKAVTKEITVGFINGVIIGSLVCLLAYLLKFDPRIGFILGIAMICNMFIAGLVGSLIPVILKSLKIDPALASSVIITMLTDIAGYACFLGLASKLMM